MYKNYIMSYEKHGQKINSLESLNLLPAWNNDNYAILKDKGPRKCYIRCILKQGSQGWLAAVLGEISCTFEHDTI